MKKKNLKTLRRLASILPKTQYVRKHSYQLYGHQLDKEHTDDIEKDGAKVDPKTLYDFKRSMAYNVNHEQRLKEAYKKNGDDGIIEYLKWIRIQHKANLKKYSSDPATKFLDERLDYLIASGAKNLWKNLLIFLTAFFENFVVKKEANEVVKSEG